MSGPSVPGSWAGRLVQAMVTGRRELALIADAALVDDADRDDFFTIAELTLIFAASALFGRDRGVADLKAFVQRREALLDPGMVDVHEAETALRDALGENVSIAGIPRLLEVRMFLILGIVQEFHLADDGIAAFVRQAEGALTESGRVLRAAD